jgi:hypothetical protein
VTVLGKGGVTREPDTEGNLQKHKPARVAQGQRSKPLLTNTSPSVSLNGQWPVKWEFRKLRLDARPNGPW